MDELDIIRQLDMELEQWDALFVAGLLTLNRSLLDSLDSLIDRLVLAGRSTDAAAWSANMQAATIWQAGLPELVGRAGLNDLIAGLLVNMGNSANRLNGYYARIVSDFVPGAYTNLIAGLAQQTRSLVLSTAEAAYQSAVGDVLSYHVLTKSTAAELRIALRTALSDAGLPVRDVGRVASDSLYTFSRGYSQAVAEGLNLKHYYYMGTQVVNTRSFCDARFGKAYTQKEVESWPDLSWSGKIPGTTKQTIYWYCGGFRCRHRLVPISKTVYKSLTVNN